MTRRLIWDATLVLAGVVYLAMVLFSGIESPLLGVTFVGLASYELVNLHRTGAK